MGLLAKNIKGTEGRITLPGVGALIGEMYSWQLYSEDGQTYILRASCNPSFYETLWHEAGDSRRIELHIMRDKWFEARPVEGASVELKNRVITVKTVSLYPI